MDLASDLNKNTIRVRLSLETLLKTVHRHMGSETVQKLSLPLAFVPEK